MPSVRWVDRRATPRFPFVAEAEIVEPISRIEVEGRTTEISMGGCYVTTTSPLPPKTIIQIVLRFEDQSFQTWARVAYNHRNIGMGLTFFDTAPDQRARLRDWISRLNP
jgi:hypothetical protein